jgi:hypothetical protein
MIMIMKMMMIITIGDDNGGRRKGMIATAGIDNYIKLYYPSKAPYPLPNTNERFKYNKKLRDIEKLNKRNPGDDEYSIPFSLPPCILS